MSDLRSLIDKELRQLDEGDIYNENWGWLIDRVIALVRADYEQKVIEAVMATVGQDVIPDYRIKRAIEAIKQALKVATK